MDVGLGIIPSIHGPRNIGHDRRENRRRSRDFEDTLDGQDSAELHQEDADNPDTIGETGLEPRPKPLQKGLPTGRRDDQDRGHIDVLA